MAGIEAVRQDVAASVQRMTVPQRLTLGLAFAATAIGLFLVSRVTGGTTMGTLYGDLDPEAAAAVVDQLETQGIPYELGNGGRVVTVPADQVHKVRLDLSAQGLPDTAEGWSILDNQGITTSEFAQRVGYQRAMEGELAKTITAIDGVSEANVHLALPEDDLFVADDLQASASVLLVTGGSQEITPTQVEAIVNLVASSVEGLTTDRVSITDQTGRLLAAPGDGNAVVGLEGDSQLRAQKGFEAGLEADLEAMLAAIVGPGLALVNVTAELDFDSVVTVTEQFEPMESVDGRQIMVAETTRAELYQGAGAGEVDVGELGVETPPVADVGGGDGADGVNYSLDERDATYALNKVVTNAENAIGQVSSLSVAVLLDESAIDAGRIGEIETLVAAAAGIDADRGDTLAVSLMPINEQVREAIVAANAPAAVDEGSGLDLIGLIRTAGTVVIVLLVLFFGLRWLRTGKDDVRVEDLDGQPALGTGPGEGVPQLGAALGEEAVEAEPPDEVLTGLIANQPEEVAGVLRSWLNEGEASS